MTIRTIQTATGASPDAIRSVWKGLGLQDWPNRDFDRVLPRHTVTTLLTQMSKPATKRTPQAVAAAQKLLAEFQAGQHQNGAYHKPETWQPVIDTTAIRESTPEPRKRAAKPAASNQPEPEQQKKGWAFTRWIKSVTMLDMVYLATIATAVYGLWFCLQEMGAAFAVPYCLISWHALRMAKNPASKRTAQAGIADYCMDSGVNWQEFELRAISMLQDAGFSSESIEYALPEFIKDFAGLLQFFHDYRVKVLAVEIPVWMEEGVATLIDLVVEMDAKNYEKMPEEKRQRHHAIINLKSGKKGFFESHVFQLVGERMMFNQLYAESLGFEIEHVYNLAPSEWKEKPGYKIKNQTETIGFDNMVDQFKFFLQIGKLRKILQAPSKKYPVFIGETKYGKSPCDALTMHTYDELSRLKIEKHHADNS